MIKDRYGNPLFADNSITVFDTDVSDDIELFEDTIDLKLRKFDRELFASAYEVDIGSGADWPAVAYEVLEKLIPFSAIAAMFFCGERIERSALAWKRMAAALLSCMPKAGFTDANGAALLALEKIFEQTSCGDVRLLAYTWIDEAVEFPDQFDKANSAFEVVAKLDTVAPRDRQFGVGLHSPPTFLFKFETQGMIILAKVNRIDAELIKL